MIRFLRAVAWARWRLLLNTLRGGGRRDTGERISRWLSVLAPAIALQLIAPLALIAAGLGAFGGFLWARDAYAVVVEILARALLFVVICVVVLGPLVRSTQGAELNTTRLSLLPVSRATLHLSHLFGAAGEPWLLVAIPGIVMLPVGMMAGGNWSAGLFGMFVALMFLLALTSLGALCTFLVVLVFRNRRRAEWVTFTAMVLLVGLGVGLSMVEGYLTGGRGEALARELGQRVDTPFALLAWARLIPSEAFGLTLRHAAAGRWGAAGLHLGLLALVACGLFALSSLAHRRLQGGSRGGARRSAGPGTRVRWTPLPGLSPEASAVARALVCGTLRTVRGKLGVYFNFAMLLLVELGTLRPMGLPDELAGLDRGPLLYLFGFLFTVLSVQPVVLNLFAVDRAGFARLLTSPVSHRDVVLGKLVGAGLLTFLSAGICLITAFALSPGSHPLYWIAGIAGSLSAYLLFAPLAALLSAGLPKSSDLSRLGRAGNPHPVAAIVGILAALIASAPGAALLVLPMLGGRSPWLATGLCLLWLAVAVPISRLLVRAATLAFGSRRENLLLIATGR